jgi:putative addiction module killer protein
MNQALVIYERTNEKSPFLDWLLGLRDIQARAIIRARINRLELGNFGDCKSVGGGVLELRVPFGPGYRVYLGRDGHTVVVLLCGGDKVRSPKT